MTPWGRRKTEQLRDKGIGPKIDVPRIAPIYYV